MFTLVILFFIIILLIYFYVKDSLVSNYTLCLDNSKIKYTLHENDREFLNKYGKKINKIHGKGVFYTDSPWKSCNYCLFNKKYYIIEPGYYYKVDNPSDFFINDLSVVFMEMN